MSSFRCLVQLTYDFFLLQQAVEDTGRRFRETILALGGGKAPLEVRIEYAESWLLLFILLVINPFLNDTVCRFLFNSGGGNLHQRHYSGTMVYWQPLHKFIFCVTLVHLIWKRLCLLQWKDKVMFSKALSNFVELELWWTSKMKNQLLKKVFS